MVVGTVLDKSYTRRLTFWTTHCFLRRERRLKQALIDAGIGMDIGGGYDNSTLQPVFSVIAKNANPEQKEQFFAGDP